MTSSAQVMAVCAALGDETRWQILERLGRGDHSASALAEMLPLTRQAIAKHLAALQAVGLVESYRAGRELRFRALGAQLSATARALEEIGAAWDRRLAAIKTVAESLSEQD
ncbi:metalloregulator ArsR/SmtB family transcription factor [Nocardioides carbamazepini]|uniref:ArsR/SmtB family transcription factor n=1 Tax=Nocardioides carbamazepini TaxID=2854259 RepID=UPI00214A4563|nr:metalloregulator ArsR/SmtB family transcription factor [Nocardioides carbamazepini]MCR1780943.1 metalloregulator ArsR/SmtB family transcription factor [Nocardioides carbamazepini]